MTNNNQIKNSFRAVKGDIMEIQGELISIKEQQLHILEQIEKLVSNLKTPVKKITHRSQRDDLKKASVYPKLQNKEAKKKVVRKK